MKFKYISRYTVGGVKAGGSGLMRTKPRCAVLSACVYVSVRGLFCVWPFVYDRGLRRYSIPRVVKYMQSTRDAIAPELLKYRNLHGMP